MIKLSRVKNQKSLRTMSEELKYMLKIKIGMYGIHLKQRSLEKGYARDESWKNVPIVNVN